MDKQRAMALVESVSNLRVLFIGDTIIDEYHYVTPLGKSPKENLVPVQYHTREVFQGGVHAAANHVRTFCKEVNVHAAGPVTRKVRMVDQTYMRKLFEIQYFDGLAPETTIHGEHDVTVWADFGHGAMEGVRLPERPEPGKCMAVNAQTNAANVGFNLITKYPFADYIVIDEPEARLAAADRLSPIEQVIEKLAAGRCKKFVVTQGTGGATGYDGQRFYHAPALTKTVVDTMGAGDAFFAVTAPMAKDGEMEDLLLIGNAAGAIKCGIIGHRESVTKDVLMRYLSCL